MHKWQPIETVPKNKTVVLLYNNKRKYVHVAYYDKENRKWPWVSLEPDGDDKEWSRYRFDYSATHWMPLPSAPVEEI